MPRDLVLSGYSLGPSQTWDGCGRVFELLVKRHFSFPEAWPGLEVFAGSGARVGLGGGKGSGCWQEELLQMRATVLGVMRTVSEFWRAVQPWACGLPLGACLLGYKTGESWWLRFSWL